MPALRFIEISDLTPKLKVILPRTRHSDEDSHQHQRAKGLRASTGAAILSLASEDRIGDNHHHLICRICGRLVDIDCAVGSAPCLTAVDDMGYEIDEAEVAYWGRCPDCLAQAQAPTHSDPSTRRRKNNKAATPRE